jgi:hypothetical protein
MSVIQISKIQVRRGQKLLIGNIPQLSSAEFAWAVDTQELFIGNGSITEGAPYVGNTKILTEHDNILELANSYKFAANNPSIPASVSRSLQSKIDEIQVSLVDFLPRDIRPDDSSGHIDFAPYFNAALDNLFVNVEDQFKKVLVVPNGNYNIRSTLRIPSRAIIRGENQLETILDIGTNRIVFVSENGTDENFTDSDFPFNIEISNLTIDHSTGQTEITASRGCTFRQVTWRSNYKLGDTVFVTENANAVYNFNPVVEAGGNIQVLGSGVSVSITQTFSGTFVSTLASLVDTLNADLTFQSNFIAVAFNDVSLKIISINSISVADDIISNFTVISQVNNAPGTNPETIVPGPDELSDGSDGSENVEASVFWNNQSFGTRTSGLTFDSCKFTETRLAIECQQSSVFNTEVKIVNSDFFIADTGIYIGGVPPDQFTGKRQENNWLIVDTKFEQLASQAFISTYGIGTKFLRTEFKNCGNGTGDAANPITSIVKFGDAVNNVLIDCFSNRHQSSAVAKIANPTTPGIIEFEGASYANLIDRNYAEIVVSDAPRTLTVFSLKSRFIIIDYFLSLGVDPLNKHSRTGQLILTVGDDLAGTDNVSPVAVSDNYVYSPPTPTSPGGSLMYNFEFSADVVDFDEDSNVETIILKYRNPALNGANGTISYSVSYGA